MIDFANDLNAIWYILVAAFGAVIWLVRLESRVNTAVRDIDQLQRSVNRLFNKSDKVDVLEQQVGKMSGLISMEAVADYNRADERTKARLDRLEEITAGLAGSKTNP